MGCLQSSQHEQSSNVHCQYKGGDYRIKKFKSDELTFKSMKEEKDDDAHADADGGGGGGDDDDDDEDDDDDDDDDQDDDGDGKEAGDF